MNTRYLPRDAPELDLFAEAHPSAAEFASELANEHTNPAQCWSVYYGMLREFAAAAQK